MKYPLLSLLLLSLLAGPIQARESFHIVMVPWRGLTAAEHGFMDYLARQGINANYTILDCQKDKTRLPGFVRQIKKIKPDLVYVFGTSGALGLCGSQAHHPANQYLTKIPVVFAIVSVPIKSGLVDSLVSSKRNITGASHLVPLASQLKAINALRPIKGLRLGVVYNPQEKNSQVAVTDLQNRAQQEGFTLVKEPFPLDQTGKPRVKAIPATIARLAAQQVEMVYLPSDSFLVANCVPVVTAINNHGLISFSATEVPIKKGGALAGLVSRYYNVGQLAGYKAQQILREHKQPQDIPMETLSRFSFMVTMSTAQKIDFYPPLSVLKFAEVLP